jgi:hypothetical protein
LNAPNSWIDQSHETEPDKDEVPFGQGRHEAKLIARSEGLYELTGQGVHASALPALNVPAGHAISIVMDGQ